MNIEERREIMENCLFKFHKFECYKCKFWKDCLELDRKRIEKGVKDLI